MRKIEGREVRRGLGTSEWNTAFLVLLAKGIWSRQRNLLVDNGGQERREACERDVGTEEHELYPVSIEFLALPNHSRL